MVAAKSVPQNRRHSSNDPFEAFLRPPPDETPAQREMRILAEQQAKQVSDAIDEQLRVERVELKRARPDVKILLLGQSESGKSTTLKQFQLLHTPAAFQAERIAWRTVIYLNLVRSVRRILDTISAEREEETFDTASITSDRRTSTSSVPTDPEIHRIAAEKHAGYSAMLAPVLELEGRLIHRLREDDEDDEATHLGDGSTPGWSTPRGEYAVRTTSNCHRAFNGLVISTLTTRSAKTPPILDAIRPTPRWKTDMEDESTSILKRSRVVDPELLIPDGPNTESRTTLIYFKSRRKLRKETTQNTSALSSPTCSL